MANYRRNVTYFYQYHNGVSGTTAGFLKMELRGDNVKVTINIQESYRDSKGKPVLYLYHETGDNLSAVKICDIEKQGGVITMQTKTPWRNVFGTGRDLYTFDGAIVLYSDNDYYLGDFKDRDRSTYEIVYAKEKVIEPREDKEDLQDKIDESEEDKADKEEKVEESRQVVDAAKEKLEEQKQETAGIEEKTKEQRQETDTSVMNNEPSENEEYEGVLEEKAGVLSKKDNCDSFDGMLSEYPKLPMYNVDELFDCVRINPRDIGKLDIGNWKLGSNSFLTHGYYTYKYLMLGRMRFDDGKKRAILGVPGVYSNREKYMANMFGFDIFIPVKKTGAKTGQFGYWIVEISGDLH